MVKDYLKNRLRKLSIYERMSKELSFSQNLSRQELSLLQDRLLGEMVMHSYCNVPYYRHVFDSLGINPEEIRTGDDLKVLPVLDKNIVRENLKEFQGRYRPVKFKAHTGGTNGTPMVLFRDLHNINFEKACIDRFMQWHGKEIGSKRVVLRGNLIVPSEQSKPPFWRYDPFANELLVSSYHLSKETIGGYCKTIKEFGYCDLYANPSMAYQLARLALEANIPLEFSKVFTSSETLNEYQRKFIRKTFNCDVADWYGCAERVAAICQCEYGQYHLLTDYSHVELLPLCEENNEYEIIGTGLHNFVMPLLRYSLGDVIKMAEKNSCRCGRDFPVVEKILGRTADYLITPDGKYISIVSHVGWGINGIDEMQLIQNESDKILVNVVNNAQWNSSSERKLKDALEKHISHEMIFEINPVDSIDRTSSGKFRAVIQNCKGIQ